MEKQPYGVLPHFILETLAKALCSRMYRESSLPTYATSLPVQQQRSQKVSWSYLEVVNHFFNTFAKIQAVTKYDALVLRYMQPSSVADDVISRSYKIADA